MCFPAGNLASTQYVLILVQGAGYDSMFTTKRPSVFTLRVIPSGSGVALFMRDIEEV
jgi:hypothetical protein